MVGRIDGPSNVNFSSNPPPSQPPSALEMNNLMADMIANPSNIAKDKAELQQIYNQYPNLFNPAQQDALKALLSSNNEAGVINSACKYLIGSLPTPNPVPFIEEKIDVAWTQAQLDGNYSPFFELLNEGGVPITNPLPH